ncbi:MAG: bifunctional folylpolyglutamate synthase/dihydrofolate synthase [Sulfobacillus acidophilus]|uniref:tetrahydrofolate synthase n=1 Tax=Sulfobacillus acidophilus TaxID=53633 RepID=A0A2T2WIN6_9FIRM|nr:MAG: bifunctional folylpolyglutamate synthase/dihydrofolate synthase [Sulfobacillus acidophilus]
MKQDWWQGQTRFGVSPGLGRISALLSRLENPHNLYPAIHVAGTNGKGSVAAMLAAGLASQGLTVGLYVSPDMGQVNDRVIINQKPLDEAEWDVCAEIIEEAGRDLDQMPTWFETITALAFLAFGRRRVDIAVIEVGLGGRLDATNVLPPPLLSVITPIAFDHMHYLGSTIAEIAGEKAGILKSGTELVLARQPFAQAAAVIGAMADRLDVPVIEVQQRARVGPLGATLVTASGEAVVVPLYGVYQAENLDTAWTALERLSERGWVSDLGAARRALAQVQWPGRFQVLSRKPLVVVDGAHNPHGMAGLMQTLQRDPWCQYRWHVVFGVLADKSADEMLSTLGEEVAEVILTRVPSERGRDPYQLLSAVAIRSPVRVIPDPMQAVRTVRAQLTNNDALVVTGSLSLLAHLRQCGLIAYEMAIDDDKK